MKINVDLDCTPEELRTFLGLPDVAPMQKAIMDEMQTRMLAEMESYSPATLMREWFAPATGVQQAMSKLFTPSSRETSKDSTEDG